MKTEYVDFSEKHYTDIKETIKSGVDNFLNTGYKPIKINIYDPKNSIVNYPKNEQAKIKIYFCKACETCEAYKKGCCVITSINYWNSKCPFSASYTAMGFTQRSKKYNDFIQIGKELQQDLTTIKGYHIKNLLKIQYTIKIGDGSLVFINLPYLSNYVNPCAEYLGINERGFIPTEKFNEETINFLLKYEPLALSGQIITDYQEREVLNFILALKLNFPELYKKVIKGATYEKRLFEMSKLGKIAFVKSLKPGKVQLNNKEWNWDGKVLTRQQETGAGVETYSVTPHDYTTVKIIDENTLKEDVIF